MFHETPPRLESLNWVVLYPPLDDIEVGAVAGENAVGMPVVWGRPSKLVA